MSIGSKQRGVLKGMSFGGFLSLCIVVFGSLLNPFGYPEIPSTAVKINVVVYSCLIPALFLAISIARLARHRFFTPEDIDGGGLSVGSEQAKVLQSLLQNTMEQTLLAIVVYAAWAVIMPDTWLSTVPLAALAFGLGRILFFTGYSKGAPARAIGFTLSFYPSLLMLVVVVGTLVLRLAVF